MAGIRIGGVAVLPACSPPFSAYEGTAFPDELMQVWRSCSDDAAGEATAITAFLDFNTIEQVRNPVLSPDGTKILFEAMSVFNFTEIWVVDAVPGSTPTQLVADGGGGAGAANNVIHPSWGPDSDTFVYVHCASGGGTTDGTIFKDTVSAPGSPVSLKVGSGSMSPYRPQFNFDGTRIAYIWGQDSGTGSSELRVMDDDGTNDASVDSTLYGWDSNEPPMLSWANTQNLIAYQTGAPGSNPIYVIADDGSGQVQINANGDAAGAASAISGFAWPADDSFVVITANIGGGFWSVMRAELDGSDTTNLSDTIGAHGPPWDGVAIVFRGRIWFVRTNDTANAARIGSMAIDGSDEVTNFDNTLGAGDYVADFGPGDGFYFD